MSNKKPVDPAQESGVELRVVDEDVETTRVSEVPVGGFGATFSAEAESDNGQKATTTKKES